MTLILPFLLYLPGDYPGGHNYSLVGRGRTETPPTGRLLCIGSPHLLDNLPGLRARPRVQCIARGAICGLSLYYQILLPLSTPYCHIIAGNCTSWLSLLATFPPRRGEARSAGGAAHWIDRPRAGGGRPHCRVGPPSSKREGAAPDACAGPHHCQGPAVL